MWTEEKKKIKRWSACEERVWVVLEFAFGGVLSIGKFLDSTHPMQSIFLELVSVCPSVFRQWGHAVSSASDFLRS